jgi:hypothetical protein
MAVALWQPWTASDAGGFAAVASQMAAGVLLWELTEYSLHRWVSVVRSIYNMPCQTMTYLLERPKSAREDVVHAVLSCWTAYICITLGMSHASARCMLPVVHAVAVLLYISSCDSSC